jgi:hypothetical protein
MQCILPNIDKKHQLEWIKQKRNWILKLDRSFEGTNSLTLSISKNEPQVLKISSNTVTNNIYTCDNDFHGKKIR